MRTQVIDSVFKEEELNLLLSSDESKFSLVLNKQGKHNDIPITLIRFEPTNSLSIGMQNVSFVISNDNKLLGFSRLLPKYSNIGAIQISKPEATIIATQFLEKYPQDLLENSEQLWIDEHDETITLNEKNNH